MNLFYYFPQKLFQSLVELLCIVQHENIVQFVGYSTETEQTIIEYHGRKILAEKINRALCFEYLQNGSLDHYISGAALQHFYLMFSNLESLDIKYYL